MTLTDCTKEELLTIIDRLMLISPNAYHVDRILNDLESERNERKYDKAGALLKTIREKTQAYIDLIGPWEGKPVMQIPKSVLDKGAQLLSEKENAEREWAKLMGFKMSGRRDKQKPTRTNVKDSCLDKPEEGSAK